MAWWPISLGYPTVVHSTQQLLPGRAVGFPQKGFHLLSCKTQDFDSRFACLGC